MSQFFKFCCQFSVLVKLDVDQADKFVHVFVLDFVLVEDVAWFSVFNSFGLLFVFFVEKFVGIVKHWVHHSYWHNFMVITVHSSRTTNSQIPPIIKIHRQVKTMLWRYPIRTQNRHRKIFLRIFQSHNPRLRMSPPDRLKAIMLRLLIEINYLGSIIGKPLDERGWRVVSVLYLRLKVYARSFEYRLESKRVLSVLLVIRAQFVGEEDGHSLASVRPQILVPECIFDINHPFSNCELIERLD